MDPEDVLALSTGVSFSNCVALKNGPRVGRLDTNGAWEQDVRRGNVKRKTKKNKEKQEKVK